MNLIGFKSSAEGFFVGGLIVVSLWTAYMVGVANTEAGFLTDCMILGQTVVRDKVPVVCIRKEDLVNAQHEPNIQKKQSMPTYKHYGQTRTYTF